MSFRILLLPFSLVYAAAAGIRNLFFNTGILKQHKFPVPVILVGNLNVGGTGKTPHVEYLLRLLQNQFQLATLSRGYGRLSNGCIIAGKGATARLIGDEPMQYFMKFKKVTVTVCESRVEGINKLLQLPQKPDVIIMDDGYQHRSVSPGFKILLTAFDKLFTRDYVLPAGDLRESRLGYLRAGCIVVTRTPENITEHQKKDIIRELNPSVNQKIFFSSIVYDAAVSFFSHETIPLNKLTNYKMVLFAGIANPDSLIHFLKRNSTDLVVEKFADHYNFVKKDMIRIKEKFGMFAPGSSIIITTEKDYLRLQGTEALDILKDLPCFYIPVTVKIDREEEFNDLVLTECKKIY